MTDVFRRNFDTGECRLFTFPGNAHVWIPSSGSTHVHVITCCIYSLLMQDEDFGETIFKIYSARWVWVYGIFVWNRLFFYCRMIYDDLWILWESKEFWYEFVIWFALVLSKLGSQWMDVIVLIIWKCFFDNDLCIWKNDSYR